MTLRLEKDAVLLASPDATLFPPVRSRWEGSQATYPAPLVVMEDCEDASIEGAGTLSGSERCVLVKECRNIGFDGITFISRLRWTLHLLYSDGIVVENCRFTTEGANTDGIDPDSSRNIVIRKCFFSTGDDCIAIKSGVNAEGVKVGRPSENISIEGNEAALIMVGMTERPIEGIWLQNITLTGGPPGRIENARDVVVESMKLDGPLKIANVTGRGLPTEPDPDSRTP